MANMEDRHTARLVGWAFMPTRFQAAFGHGTRGQQVPTLPCCTFSGSPRVLRGQHIPTLRWDWGRLNRNRVRAYRTHPTSGLEVSCGLRLAWVGAGGGWAVCCYDTGIPIYKGGHLLPTRCIGRQPENRLDGFQAAFCCGGTLPPVAPQCLHESSLPKTLRTRTNIFRSCILILKRWRTIWIRKKTPIFIIESLL